MAADTNFKSHTGFSDAPVTDTSSLKRSKPDDELCDDINRFTNLPYSQRYYTILEKRRELPAWSARKNFVKLLRRNQVIILVGETGSGKTTQIPQFVVNSKLNQGLQVAVTQPRRVAAMSVAARVADEMDVELGETVGYSIRFEDKTSKNTVIKFMTDGMLLREAITDPMLRNYGVIILDEAHERTVSTDVLFGLIKEVAGSREDLKIVVMSATLDGKKFQKYFGGADMLSIPGRTFPVEIFYTSCPQKNYVDAVFNTVIRIHKDEDEGDILVFLTGEDEILKLKQRLDSRNTALSRVLTVLPLYGSMDPREQEQVFKQVEGRKCVLATNIAETSLTIDGIVYVVDTGFAKQNVYNPRARVESLLVAPISQASAAQRAGRAGRTRPGKCFRLYTEEAYKNELIPQTFPEILRSNIATVVLNLKKLGIDDLVHFDFMDPPAPETMMRALEELNYLKALDDEGELTPTGDLMAEFPLEPQLAKMVVVSPKYGCTRDVIALVAMLSVPNVFMRSQGKRDGLKTAYSDRAYRLRSKRGDHLTMLNVFNAYVALVPQGRRVCEDFCYEVRASTKGLDSAVRVFEQLAKLAQKHLKVDCTLDHKSDPVESNVLRCLCAGFFQQTAYSSKGTTYYTVKDNQAVALHPSSILTSLESLVVYHQIVHTSRTFLRTVSSVELSWLLETTPEYFDPNTIPNRELRELIKRALRDR
ncbi:Helicase associated domain (HA2) family protein [Babesia bovis T2Bo]|uniref:RNA helicase n=1 Tax=Babesia bovis TaxID=5865 RepID=A7AWT7_BABBO|nr:Helicase associated domain (HA2) family protein [Babesia bovis T2Bo]EDO05515.1 Helicase associated domain (HA2) family protein [Babesia bovis T2Bo]|eukprot:XP_001609083.1 pre-mRNA splicing factor RNA helicase [Babesia bovis T2Bo]